MSTTKEKPHDLANRAAMPEENRSSTLSVLTIGLGAVCFLVSFTYLHGTEQLLLISLGAMLIGGSR
jgi:hypothetical protein